MLLISASVCLAAKTDSATILIKPGKLTITVLDTMGSLLSSNDQTEYWVYVKARDITSEAAYFPVLVASNKTNNRGIVVFNDFTSILRPIRVPMGEYELTARQTLRGGVIPSPYPERFRQTSRPVRISVSKEPSNVFLILSNSYPINHYHYELE